MERNIVVRVFISVILLLLSMTCTLIIHFSGTYQVLLEMLAFGLKIIINLFETSIHTGSGNEK